MDALHLGAALVACPAGFLASLICIIVSWSLGRVKYSKPSRTLRVAMPRCLTLGGFVIFTLIAQMTNALPGFDTSSHYNLEHKVRLKSDTPIPDSGTLTLPITVSPEPIAIQADGPPKIVKVDSTKPDLQYGVGEEILIDVTFTSPVDVAGAPTLQMETGCKSAACRVKEVQSFTCLADEGKFSLTFRKTAADNDYQQQVRMGDEWKERSAGRRARRSAAKTLDVLRTTHDARRTTLDARRTTLDAGHAHRHAV
jgi:hypothetical protein